MIACRLSISLLDLPDRLARSPARSARGRRGGAPRTAAAAVRRGPAASRRAARAPTARARRRRRPSSCAAASDSTLRRIATALRGARGEGRSSSSSSAVKLAPSGARSNAASTPIASPRAAIGTISTVRASGTPSSLGATRSSRGGVDALGAAALEHLAGGRPGDRHAVAANVLCLARARVDDEIVAVAQHDHDAAGVDQGSAPLDDQLEHAVKARLAADGGGDVARRLQAAHGAVLLDAAALAGLIEAGILDRRRRQRRRGSPRPPRRPSVNSPPSSFSVR